MATMVTTEGQSTADAYARLEFRPRSLPINIAHNAASMWADPTKSANRATSVPPVSWRLKTADNSCRRNQKRRHVRVRNTQLKEQLATKRPRIDLVTDRLKYLDPQIKTKDSGFTKPSPLVGLIQCCERILREQKPAPFDQVLPDRYMEEVVGSGINLSTSSGQDHVVEQRKPDAVEQLLFRNFDSLIGCHPFQGLRNWSDSQTRSHFAPSIPMSPDFSSVLMQAQMPLMPMTPLETLIRMQCIALPDRAIVPVQSLQSRGVSPSEGPIQGWSLNSGNADPPSVPLPLGPIDNVKSSGAAIKHPQSCDCTQCLYNRIVQDVIPKPTINQAVMHNQTFLPNTVVGQLPCETIAGSSETSHQSRDSSSPSKSRARSELSYSNSQVEGDWKTSTTQIPAVHSSLSMLANLILFTALVQQASMPIARTDVDSNPAVGQVRPDTATCGGSTPVCNPITGTSAAFDPTMWAGSQPSMILSTLLGLLTAPPIPFPRL